MNYLKIDNCSVCNGIGFRITFWVAGCEHNCKGCQNPESWDFNAGKICTKKSIYELLDLLNPSYIDGVTFSGGDPLNPKNVIKKNTDDCTIYDIVKEIRKRFGKSKTIWAYTGYKWEQLLDMSNNNYEYNYILNNIDVIVDGEYQQSCRDITLPFRGSLNQNIIDVQESLVKQKLIKWRMYNEIKFKQ